MKIFIVVMIMLLTLSISFVSLAQSPAVVQGKLYVDKDGDGVYTIDIDVPVPDGAVLVVDLIAKDGGLYYADDNGFFRLPDAQYSLYHLQGECGPGDIVDVRKNHPTIYSDIEYQECEPGRNIPSLNEVLSRYSQDFIDDVIYSPVPTAIGDPPTVPDDWFKIYIPFADK